MVIAPTWTYVLDATPELEEAVCRRLRSGMRLADAFTEAGVPLWAGVEWCESVSISPHHGTGAVLLMQAEINNCVNRIRAMACAGDTDSASWLMERGRGLL